MFLFELDCFFGYGYIWIFFFSFQSLLKLDLKFWILKKKRVKLAPPFLHTTPSSSYSHAHVHWKTHEKWKRGWRQFHFPKIVSKIYIVMKLCFFLKIALLNLITISSTWARVIDVMDSEVCILPQEFDDKYNFFGTRLTVPYSVRFQIIWFYWCWSHTWTALWVIVCHRNGFLGAMYVCLFNLYEFLTLSLWWILNHELVFCSFTTVFCFADGVCGTVIKRDNPGCAPSPWGTNTHQVSYIIKISFSIV